MRPEQVVPAGTNYNMMMSEGQATAIAQGEPRFGAWASGDPVSSQIMREPVWQYNLNTNKTCPMLGRCRQHRRKLSIAEQLGRKATWQAVHHRCNSWAIVICNSALCHSPFNIITQASRHRSALWLEQTLAAQRVTCAILLTQTTELIDKWKQSRMLFYTVVMDISSRKNPSYKTWLNEA